MCGFVGFIDENDQTYDHRAVIVTMADAIAHRGPDSEGYFEAVSYTHLRAHET